jgi:cobalt/nickel transport system permease protein
MHLGNGAITPECGLFALGVAAASTGIAIFAARSKPLDRGTVFTAAALGAAVFAAQMFNVQIGAFSSVHLIGGVLLAWTLGPRLGLAIMTAVLTLEAALRGDGGFLSLGVNVINMGVVPALFVVAARRLTRGDSTLRTGLALAATCFLATLAGAGLVLVEIAIGRSANQISGWSGFAGQMLESHLIFGAIEGMMTIAIVGLLGGLGRPAGAPLQLPRAWSAVIAATALAIAVLSAPQFGLASSAPDGYETAVAAAKSAGSPLGHLDSTEQAGRLNVIVEGWQQDLVSRLPGSAAVQAIFCTLAAGAIGGALAVCCSQRRKQSSAH